MRARAYVFNAKLDQTFREVYRAYKFVMRFFREVVQPPWEWREVLHQGYQVGVNSLPLTTLTGFVTGMVFTTQSRQPLEEFGATSWLPNLIAIAIIRALAPLVTSLIAAGKVGSNIGAELGSMRVTEQIDAMEVSATNPFKFLVVTRVLATTLMMPVLVIYFGFVGMLGSYVNVHQKELTSFPTFWDQAFNNIVFLDFTSSMVKALFFGFTIGIVGCYQGYHATMGTQGVGKAANRAVVLSMFLIFIEEILIVQITNWIRYA